MHDHDQGPLPRGAKCTRCRRQAEIRLPSHHANFCPDCFLHFFRNGVERALKKMRVSLETPLMIAVSGGKDSLAVWDILHRLGFSTKGLHLDLGIPGFSEASRAAVAAFAQPRGLPWSVYELKEEFGYTIPEINTGLRGKICAQCGRIKRHSFDRLTAREGFQTLVTGHNLDDEAGRLLGNLLANRQEFVRKQHPCLPSPHPDLPAKLKPLYRVDIQEIKTYCRLQGVEPASATCSYSKRATSHVHKQALEFLEAKMTGTKRSFLFSYLKGKPPPEPDPIETFCSQCGHPSYLPVCGLCSLYNRIAEKKHD